MSPSMGRTVYLFDGENRCMTDCIAFVREHGIRGLVFTFVGWVPLTWDPWGFLLLLFE